VKMYELDTTDDQATSAVQASAEFASWCRDLIGERRARPTNDLVSGLCTVETSDGRLSDSEIISTIVLLLNAGHEATVNSLGSGIVSMLAVPEAWASVRSGQTFRGGIHTCIGAPLARLDLSVALERMTALMPTLRLAEPPQRHPAFVIHGYEAVRLEAY
ncbi:MAG: hypothetical protein U9R51_10405, partial [Actinomycetota bacterium]|nr:hypothetical protein [Actinomycetota bacterium]